MGGRNFALEAYLEMIHFSLPPLGARDWPGWFWTKRCHTSFFQYCMARVQIVSTKYILDDFGQNDVTLIEEPQSSVH